jgi:hypothetical protein
MTETVARETQWAAAMAAVREAHEMGFGEVTVEVTRGGTVRVIVKAERAKVSGSTFTTGRKR